jgi:hypothetical protein
VGQNLLQVTGRGHRKLVCWFNLKSETQNPKFHLNRRRSLRLVMLSLAVATRVLSCGEISISETK